MIKRIISDNELNLLLGNCDNCVEAQKIGALAACYGTKYDFCRFYKAGSSILCGLNNSYILYGCDNPDELAAFFTLSRFSDIFCAHMPGEKLSRLIGCRCRLVNLMRFNGRCVSGSGVLQNTESDTPLEELYEILKTGFDIEFEPWYLDISHRIRHGVTQTRRLENSALVIQHNINGAALLSQIATLPKSRGKGNASRLILSVCAELSPSKVYVICEDKLLGFYKHIGFELEGKKSVLLPRLER